MARIKAAKVQACATRAEFEEAVDAAAKCCVQREKLPSARQSAHTVAFVGGSKVNVSFVPTPTSAKPEATRVSVTVRG